MSAAKKGKAPWNKGKKYSASTIEKLRASHLGQKAWNKGMIGVVKGRGGDKCPFWKGGISPINALIRMSTENKLWRKSVYERDNYTCQKYGTTGGRLNAHHINNFADFPELRFAIDNGITLSEKAHREFHKKYGRHNNTREQLMEFLSNNNG